VRLQREGRVQVHVLSVLDDSSPNFPRRRNVTHCMRF
jgi:hypothetical protein